MREIELCAVQFFVVRLEREVHSFKFNAAVKRGGAPCHRLLSGCHRACCLGY